MNPIDFVSNYRMELPAPWPRGGWLAIAISVGILLTMALGIRVFAHGGDGPAHDFAIVAYDQSLPDAAQEFDRRGFSVQHIDYLGRHMTCNEHGARQAAENAHKMGQVAAYAFAGNYDYSICGETSPCCSLYGVNGEYREGPIPDNGYIDA